MESGKTVAMFDDEVISQQQSLLDTYRRSLYHLLSQAAQHGGESAAPLPVIHSIHEARAGIRQIKSFLRSHGISVIDHPGDEHIFDIHLFLEERLLISATRKNRLKIDSSFLNWRQCTIMMWVLVPPKGKDLRDTTAHRNRYLLAHQTGSKMDVKMIQWTNLFALRYSQSMWQVAFSNNKAKSNSINIEDRIETGWHNFFIAWDRTKQTLSFLIDGAKSGSRVYRSSFYWPEKLIDELTVGAWTLDSEQWDDRYCETELYRLLIANHFLDSTDSIVKEHLQNKPELNSN